MTYEMAIQALADQRRREIFDSLRIQPRPVGELAELHPVSRPAVSQHLKVLETAGLVSAKKDGTKRIYAVRREGLEPLRDYIESFWTDVLDAFADEVRNEIGSKQID